MVSALLLILINVPRSMTNEKETGSDSSRINCLTLLTYVLALLTNSLVWLGEPNNLAMLFIAQ